MSAPEPRHSGDLACRREGRREDVRKATSCGLDFVEIGSQPVADQTLLEVFFLGRAPPAVGAANVVLTGGRPVRVVRAQVHRQRDPMLDDWMEVQVDRPGDFATYRLALVELDDKGRPTGTPLAGLDPRYASVCFSFKASCPTEQDCAPPQACPSVVREEPEISYLAKDYDSFRQLALDRLAVTLPGWTETHVPDIGVMLVDLLAYVGDQLSYYQDAVATEAYLGTARQRISMRRHARLVDYVVHEGCNARAWVAIDATADAILPADSFYFVTTPPERSGTGVLQPADRDAIPTGSVTVFEPLLPGPTQPFAVFAAHGRIEFYTWGDCACCLPKGATHATLLDHWAGPQPDSGERQRRLHLRADDVLVLEEVIGPSTGDPADADPAHRQAVRLTRVTAAVDPLYDAADGGRPVLQVEWCPQDALGFALCLSAVMPAPDCTCRGGISVARGNVLLVDHGRRVFEDLGTVPIAETAATCPTECAPAAVTLTAGPYPAKLGARPVTFSEDLPRCGCASALTVQDARQAVPRVVLANSLPTAIGPVVRTWGAKPDLLESGPADRNFVVETDDAGIAHLRFGNGHEGAVPDAGSSFRAAYRVGCGPDGNVGAESIRWIAFRSVQAGIAIEGVRNPLPAVGGTAAEPLSEVRMLAPHSFRDVVQRAVTADDYATLAADNDRRQAERPRLLRAAATLPIVALPQPDDRRAGLEEEPGEPSPLPDLCAVPFRRLQAAHAALRWTGSWYEADVAIDPAGTAVFDPILLAEIAAYLSPYRRIGHDLAVAPAIYVPLDIGLSICVMADRLRAPVEVQLRDVLGSRLRPDGQPGLFHPDALTFGQGVHASPIIAAAQAVPGVSDVQLLRLDRFTPGRRPPGTKPDMLPAGGVLRLGRFEIGRLDDDANEPGHGRLTLRLRGGR